MAPGDGNFRNRATSIFSITRRESVAANKRSGSLKVQHTELQWNEKAPAGMASPGLEKMQTSSSGDRMHHTSGENAAAHNREAQRIVRTIPTWVHRLDEDEEDQLHAAKPLLSPATAHVAPYNPLPSPSFWASHPQRGRLHDHQRDSTPPLPKGNVHDTSSRWRAFATSSMYPRSSADLEGETVTEDWLAEHGADYSQPWLEGGNEGDEEKGTSSMFRSRIKRRAWYLRLQRTILRSPVVPLVIRMIVFGFSMTALGLAGSIHHLTVINYSLNSTPSTKMAIIVDAVALVYLLYITYDEYSGKPLGLRPATAKMRLLFLDLFFIVFGSANLSLAFEAVEDRVECGVACSQQRALAGVLLVALVAWLMTFSISVMRVVERVNSR